MRFITKKRVAAAAAAVVIAGGGMAAYAYWTAGGSGSGSASTGTTTGITVNQTSTVTGLYPGAAGVALSGDFSNTNTGAVHVSTFSASVHAFSSQTDATKPACTQSDFTITGTPTFSASVPTGANQGSWSGLTISMVNGAGNQDNCKSLTGPNAVQIDYTTT